MTPSFRVLLTTMEHPPETVSDVVLTCVVLRNILSSQYNGQHGGEQAEDDEFLSGHDRNPVREAKSQRVYFSNEEAVSWQDDRI